MRCSHHYLVARIGGDEFVVLMDQLSEAEGEALVQAEALAQQLLAAAARPCPLQEQASPRQRQHRHLPVPAQQRQHP